MKKRLNFKNLIYVLLVLIFGILLPFNSVVANNPVSLETEYISNLNTETIRRQVVSENAMVSSAHPLASQAGLEMLLQGGNAIDAAVATAFALGVVRPNSSGLGGGGFMLYYDAETKEITVLDYREVAPLAMEPDLYENPELEEDAQYKGILSVGIPGQVAGNLEALERFGTMDRQAVLKPAIRYSEDGLLVRSTLAGYTESYKEDFLRFDSAAADIYLKNGEPYETGDILYQTEKAETLKIIAEEGKDGFYRGEVADKFVEYMEHKEGLITHEDLEWYVENRPRILEPAKGDYKGYSIFSMPPPSSGGIHIVQMLNMLENFDVHDEPTHPHNIHIISEIFKLAFADRSEYLGDVDFIDVPLEGLMSKEYAKTRSENIDMDSVLFQPEPGNPFNYQSGDYDSFKQKYSFSELPKESQEKGQSSTTHFSVVDEQGNMVTVTNTINWFFGSRLVVPEIGVKLNNELGDFVGHAGEANSPEPLKSPLSSMSPTIVLDENDEPFAALGTPGGTYIFPTVMQDIVNLIDHNMSIQEAIEHPNIWSSGENLIMEGNYPYSTISALEDLGHAIDIGKVGWPHYIFIDQENGYIIGGNEPEVEGRSFGY